MRAVKSVLVAAKNLKFEQTKKAKTANSKFAGSYQESSMVDGSEMPGYNVSRFSGEETEEALVLKSIMDVNLPKFLKIDIPLFDGII